MRFHRYTVRFLVLIILIKSLHCVVAESQFRPATQLGLSIQVNADVERRPGNSNSGDGNCNDSGCLCKGAIFAKPVIPPSLRVSLDDWTASEVAEWDWQNEVRSNQVGRIHGESVGLAPFGRYLRYQMGSLTI